MHILPQDMALTDPITMARCEKLKNCNISFLDYILDPFTTKSLCNILTYTVHCKGDTI